MNLTQTDEPSSFIIKVWIRHRNSKDQLTLDIVVALFIFVALLFLIYILFQALRSCWKRYRNNGDGDADCDLGTPLSMCKCKRKNKEYEEVIQVVQVKEAKDGEVLI